MLSYLRMAAIILALLSALTADPAGAHLLAARPVVTDGDTIVMAGQPVRLHGIDAPETDQVCIDANLDIYRCGIAAREALQRLIGNAPVMCVGQEVDRYGRLIATCTTGDVEINAWMVETGWALAFDRYSHEYVSHQERARQNRRGLWNGAFIAPWNWRRRGAETEILGAISVPIDAQQYLLPVAPAAGNATTDCLIKGNISRSGERIYHLPGMADYGRTRINESKGEHWFCSEEEAQAAGWRRALR